MNGDMSYLVGAVGLILFVLIPFLVYLYTHEKKNDHSDAIGKFTPSQDAYISHVNDDNN